MYKEKEGCYLLGHCILFYCDIKPKRNDNWNGFYFKKISFIFILKYKYDWGVNDAESKNYYGQEQSSDDAGRVEGKYFVWLADGRLMTVEYYVDGDSGFVPTITFSDPDFNPPADAPPRPT